MKRFAPLALVVVLAAACASDPAPVPEQTAATSSPSAAPTSAMQAADLPVRFSSRDEAAAFLSSEDAFTRALSDFDRGFRLEAEAPNVDDETYRAHLATTALEWTEQERAAYAESASNLAEAMAGLKLPVPDRVLLVRTDGRDEFGAAYTRENAIILPRKDALREHDRRVGLLAHELFHVASRTGGDAFRDRVYDLLGFVRLPRPLKAPPELEARRLTNPDAHAYAYAITVNTADGPRRVVPVLSSSKPLPEARQVPFGHMLELNLLAVDANGVWARSPAGTLLGYPVEETDYAKRVGINTGYIVHPDEVLADNFSLLVGRRRGRTDLPIKDAAFLDKLEKLLSE